MDHLITPPARPAARVWTSLIPALAALAGSVTGQSALADTGGGSIFDEPATSDLGGECAYNTLMNVGPGEDYATIGAIPWESLGPGDIVQIHWRPEPYREKWVLGARGEHDRPIIVRGIPGPDGSLPIIDGRDATTRPQLNYWNEDRSVIKVGGANIPADTMPAHILIENLEIRSARPPYTFTGRAGLTDYRTNAAGIFIEKGEHITIRNCVLHDHGNGLMIARDSSDIVIEHCHIYGNGIEGSIYQHNTYTEARGIVYQFNHMGRLRDGCLGNNLKDRSAGSVIRYNWIEDGNRQLDLVDSGTLHDDPAYRTTYVYGNILIEGEGQGNPQIVHYGGDSGNEERYRKGTLYFFNNTIVSTRTDGTTLLRLSSNGERCEMINNIVYVTAPGNSLAISNDAGTINMRHNWIKQGWIASHGAPGVHDKGGNISGEDPGFIDTGGQDFRLSEDSPARGSGIDPQIEGHPVDRQYGIHRSSHARPTAAAFDRGAFQSTGDGY